MLYCELLAAPGILSKQYSHYARDLETIVQSAVQIVERLAAAQTQRYLPLSSAFRLSTVPVCDLASDLRQLQPLLASIAGPAIRLSIATLPCAGRIALSVEDLTRILVNLVRNAADAMPSGGRVRIAAQYGSARTVAITVTDDGPGIPEPLREQIFDLGFTTRHNREKAAWPALRRRGLGLSIVRNLVEAAGGTVHVSSPPTSGARFEIVLPIAETITSGTCAMPPNSAFATDGHTTGCIECH
jgi:signal transduction histidine kinase